MDKKHLKNIFLFLIFGIIAGVLLLESGLDIYGFIAKRVSIPQTENFQGIRLAVFGDSFTYGVGVKNEDSYPAQLQKMLDIKSGKGKYEVINLGMPGENSSRLAKNLPRYIRDFSPDIAVILIGNSDIGVFDLGGDIKFKLCSVFSWAKSIIRSTDDSIKTAEKSEIKPVTPQQISSNQRVLSLLLQGNTYRNNRDFNKAIGCYREALNIEPQNIFLKIEQVRTLKNAGHYREAIELAMKIIRTKKTETGTEIYIELAHIFELTGNGWNFIACASGLPDTAFLIIKNITLQKNATLTHLIKKAYNLYCNKNYDHALEMYRQIYAAYGSKLIFEKETFSLCPEWTKYELLTMLTYAIANSLLSTDLKDMAEYCRAKKIKLFIMGYPEFLPDAAKQVAEKKKLPLLDIRPLFRNHLTSPDREKYLLKNGHCTALGNRLIAEYLENAVSAQ